MQCVHLSKIIFFDSNEKHTQTLWEIVIEIKDDGKYSNHLEL